MMELQPWAMFAKGPPWMSTGVLGGLDKIGIDGVLEEDRYCASYTHILDIEGLVFESIAQKDVVYPTLEVFEVFGKAENGHYLTGGSDVEACLLGDAVGVGPESGDYLPQRPVVHVHNPLPEDLLHPEAFLAVLVDVIVQQCG